jgi:8-oxo-dGTP pyrophosphatase MutT (NUDIX family)
MNKRQALEQFFGQQEPEVVMNVAAAVVVREINKEKYVLLVQRSSKDHWPNFWEFPRGKCDKPIGEDIFRCVKREIKEETGLDVLPGNVVDIYEYIADEGKRRSICHNILCKMQDETQKVKLSKEHQDFRWVNGFGLIELLLLPDQKRVLEKVLNRDHTIVSYPEKEEIIQVKESRKR